MADAFVQSNPGAGPQISTRTTPEGNNQQVVVLGIPDQDAVAPSLAPTDADPNVATPAIVVRHQEWDGSQWVRVRTPSVFKMVSAVASGATVWTPTSGKKFRILGWVLAGSAATNITLTDTGTAGGVAFIIPTALGAPSVSPRIGGGFLSSTINNTLVLTTGSGTASGFIFGTEE